MRYYTTSELPLTKPVPNLAFIRKEAFLQPVFQNSSEHRRGSCVVPNYRHGAISFDARAVDLTRRLAKVLIVLSDELGIARARDGPFPGCEREWFHNAI